MISKKEAVTLGMLAIGGVGAAMVVSGAKGEAVPDTGVLGVRKGRAGGILGTQKGYGTQEGYGAPSIYQVPAQAAAVFPEPTDYTSIIKQFLAPQEPDIGRGAAGISSPGKVIRGAHKKVVESGFDVSTTFTGTPTTPAFVQKEAYHQAMLKELGLTTPKKAVTTIKKKKEPLSRRATPGRLGYSKAAKAAGFA